ncbi:FG-GAP repeat domain-containing protein [Tahibacter harae]|uniref:VCBS repeat-containing protein n=1 Tax=Tahibacter harae TaxID=2963937 RepID=A0ABT1QVD2_9GAMM|nr:VCBS repeat-containing protein [Tahibacter harae]MCQ4166244.1 VCBS repeat-containing protein [Tahibacter harae]
MKSHRIPGTGAALLALAAATPAWAQTAAPYSVAARIELTGYTRNFPWAAADTHLLVAGDLNADGVADLAAATPGVWFTLIVAPDGSFPLAVYRQEDSSSSGIAAADFNNDSKGDLAIGLADRVLINYGNGSGGFTGGPQVAVGSVGPNALITDIAAADFNRDGYVDLAVVDADPLNDARTHGSGGNIIRHRESIALLRGTSDGSVAADPVRPRLPAPQFPLRARREDFNGDGRPELLVGSNDTISLLFNESSSGFAAASLPLYPGGLHAQVDVIASAGGDFNGDGRRDLAAISTFPTANAVGGYYRVHLYRNAPHPSLPYTLTPEINEIALPHPAGALVVTDFNGDTYADVVVGFESAGAHTLAFYAGRNNFTFDPPRYFDGGFDAGAMAVADFNNDGKPDIAVMDCSGGAFVILRHD